MYEKVWLAGLGAYARYEKFGLEGKKLFEELVEDGEDVRDRATDKVDELKQRAQLMIGRVKGVLRSKTGEQNSGEDLQQLSLQIKELSEAIKSLSRTEEKSTTTAATTTARVSGGKTGAKKAS